MTGFSDDLELKLDLTSDEEEEMSFTELFADELEASESIGDAFWTTLTSVVLVIFYLFAIGSSTDP